MNGILLIDKPVGPSSYDVIRHIKGLFKESNQQPPKIGHAGTLDPLASGLLVVLVGTATKRQSEYMKLDKNYAAEIILGSTSATDDAEGPLTKIEDTGSPSRQDIETALKNFRGSIQQLPPQHSAAKVDGQRAYKLARAGTVAELKARTVTIYSCQVKEYKYPLLNIEVKVSSGTYIRSLARDLGQKLGTGGYLSSLRRTQIGEYRVDSAVELDQLNMGSLTTALLA